MGVCMGLDMGLDTWMCTWDTGTYAFLMMFYANITSSKANWQPAAHPSLPKLSVVIKLQQPTANTPFLPRP